MHMLLLDAQQEVHAAPPTAGLTAPGSCHCSAGSMWHCSCCCYCFCWKVLLLLLPLAGFRCTHHLSEVLQLRVLVLGPELGCGIRHL